MTGTADFVMTGMADFSLAEAAHAARADDDRAAREHRARKVAEELERNRRACIRFLGTTMLAPWGGPDAFGGVQFYRDDPDDPAARFRLGGHHFEYVPERYGGWDGGGHGPDGLFVLGPCRCGSGMLAPVGRLVRTLAELDGRLGEAQAPVCDECADESGMPDDTPPAQMVVLLDSPVGRLISALQDVIADARPYGDEV